MIDYVGFARLRQKEMLQVCSAPCIERAFLGSLSVRCLICIHFHAFHIGSPSRCRLQSAANRVYGSERAETVCGCEDRCFDDHGQRRVLTGHF